MALHVKTAVLLVYAVFVLRAKLSQQFGTKKESILQRLIAESSSRFATELSASQQHPSTMDAPGRPSPQLALAESQNILQGEQVPRIPLLLLLLLFSVLVH